MIVCFKLSNKISEKIGETDMCGELITGKN